MVILRKNSSGQFFIMQKPAKGIMFNSDNYYTIACDCGHKDHQVEMWIEIAGEKEIQSVEITFFINTTTPFWKKGFSRVKAAWDILFNGYREDHHTLILRKEAAENVASAISEAVKNIV